MIFNCDCCGREFDSTEMTEINRQIICENCRDVYYTQCSCCGSWIIRDYEYSYDEEFYCEDCFNEQFCKCADCSKVYPIDDMHLNHCDEYVCDDCFECNYFVCDGCDDIYCLDDEHSLDDESYCESCFEYILEDHGIHEYCYKPDPIFYHTNAEDGLRKDNLHVGIELEIQGRDRFGFCDNIKRNYSNEKVYLKLDGSLSCGGIEIVSMPMTKKYIFQDKMWEDIFYMMEEFNMDNTNNCGLHFHLDRQYLDKNAISIIDYVVNTFSDYFEKIGGRPFNDYNGYYKKVDKSYSEWGKDVTNRYVAVNLENNSTVELRFCKSTTDYNVFCERVKMIFALVRFSLTYEFKDVITWSKRKFLIRFKKCLINV